jgi:hypothetical protein
VFYFNFFGDIVMSNELGELLARCGSESNGGYDACRIHGHWQIFKGKWVAAKRHWLAVVLWVLCAPYAFGYSSDSVWAPPYRGNYPPAPEGSVYAPGSPQKDMPSAPLPHKKIPYLDARRIVMAHGWKPRPTEDKPDYDRYKCGNPEGQYSFNKDCKKFPELATASGLGADFCKMRFYKDHVQLNIFIYECELEHFSNKKWEGNQVVGWEVVHFTDD